MVLSSDEQVFGGWRNVSKDFDVEFATEAGDFDGRPHSFTAYAPSRTVAVYAPAQFCDSQARQIWLCVPPCSRHRPGGGAGVCWRLNGGARFVRAVSR